MWCGSLPVGRRLTSFQVSGSITLTVASCEFSTKTGVGAPVHQPAAATDAAARPMAQRKKNFTVRFKEKEGAVPVRQRPFPYDRVMQKVQVNGIGIEVQRLPGDAGGRRAPIIVLHE